MWQLWTVCACLNIKEKLPQFSYGEMLFWVALKIGVNASFSILKYVSETAPWCMALCHYVPRPPGVWPYATMCLWSHLKSDWMSSLSRKSWSFSTASTSTGNWPSATHTCTGQGADGDTCISIKHNYYNSCPNTNVNVKIGMLEHWTTNSGLLCLLFEFIYKLKKNSTNEIGTVFYSPSLKQKYIKEH